MYDILLIVHSWTRWFILIFAVLAIFKAFSGWMGQKPFTKQDNILGASFVGFIHLQTLLGGLLYFAFSPMGLQAIQSMGMKAVMQSAGTRYWAVEHITVMILAVIVAQTGRSLSKKATTDLAKHKKSAIFYTIALLLILSRIPWDSVRLFRY
ncbi:hypothetical protein AD998_01555 [bacterium 336/3]|nr:hypothetical protein AD998_01555 [bacterium 336/3]